MFKRFKPVAVALVACSVALAGCGQGGFAQADPASKAFGLLGYQEGPKRLALTDAQKGQIKAILEQHKPDFNPEEKRAHLEALKKLILADSVDTAALKAWVAARKVDFQAHRTQRLAVAGELRAVLTDAQRATLLAELAKDPGVQHARFQQVRAKIHERLVAELELTAAQQGALNTLEAKVESLRDPARARAVRQAIANFVQSGDQAALGASLQAQQQAAMPLDEAIAFVASLDKAQRARIVGKLEGFAFARFAGHGPWGH